MFEPPFCRGPALQALSFQGELPDLSEISCEATHRRGTSVKNRFLGKLTKHRILGHPIFSQSPIRNLNRYFGGSLLMNGESLSWLDLAYHCQCVFVCVNHLKRCKTSTFDFILSVLFALFHFKQGDHPCTVSDGPTKRPQYMRISRLITVTYLLFHVHVLQWDVANPRTTKPFSNNWFCNLHGCRNLSREVTTWFRWISCF